MAAIPEVTPAEARDLLANRNDTVLLDVREEWEYELAHLDGSRLIPMGDIPSRLGELNQAHTFLVFCHHGNRSRQVATWLQSRGYTVMNVAGGIQAWAETIDPELPQY